MWLMTTFGFFSIVQKPGDEDAGTLTVRSRVKADLVALRERYLPDMGAITANAGTDYKFRAKAPRASLAVALLDIVRELDYSNFKNAVAKSQGHSRAHAYGEVWHVLYGLQNEEDIDVEIEAAVESDGIRRSYGGILFDEDGRVLLREPTGHFDGYVWTFPKGVGERGDTPQATALREVKEETGFDAEILCAIPGVFQGGTGENRYFLMRPVNAPSKHDSVETASVRWATPEEARALIQQNSNSTGRARDLAVLDAALKAWEEHNG